MKEYPKIKHIKIYPAILDVCQSCTDKDKCHRTFDEIVKCKRTGSV